MGFAPLLAFISAVSPPTVGPPRVALVYSDYGNFRHRDDYDAVMSSLGWPMEKYENVRFEELASSLEAAQYDIVLGSALYNYSHEQDFGKWWQSIEKHLQRGGAVVLTDVNYVEHVRWLEACLGHRYAVSIGQCEARDRINWISPDAGALTSFPRAWSPRAMWA
ncbi:MAG: hypothetical protein H5T86_05420, partial [Armatimonadetes bacterium]|nr:hypothetical protein [Armatimonadota bacterium]